MCGIAGYFLGNRTESEPFKIRSMIRSIRHRGPDDEGFTFINTTSDDTLNTSGSESDYRIRQKFAQIENNRVIHHNLAIAHRRFSIIDLSPSGHQPMWEETNTVCVSFNGEIYNYVELRKELEQLGFHFFSTCDTEVLIKSYLAWGTNAFTKFNGPWALALYDRCKRKLLLSRDRIGKVPLYYCIKDNCFYWSSEIKSFFSVTDISKFPIREKAVDDYITYDLRDVDGTFWEDIKDFPVASYAWVNTDFSLEIHKYWELPSQRYKIDEINIEEATQTFKELLWDSIRIRLRADVPVAFELSGGMDSSSLVGLNAINTLSPFPTYTVKFEEKEWDEEPYARSLAEMYPDKIRYNVIRPTKDDFWKNADQFISLQEEPFHSPNLHTNQHQRKIIRDSGVKVVITGSAGDEVLAGYAGEYFLPYLLYLWNEGRYKNAFNEFMKNTEYSLKKIAGLLLSWKYLQPLRKLNSLIRVKSFIINEIYNKPILSQNNPSPSADFSVRIRQNMTMLKMNYWLRSGNKATLGIPIEPRAPFLDYRIVEFAFTLPPELLIRNGWHKWILRNAMKDILPKTIVWRKNKMGFPFPYKEWLSYSRNLIEANLKDINCPFINTKRLLSYYNQLIQMNPVQLWRLICICLWWRKIVQHKDIMVGNYSKE